MPVNRFCHLSLSNAFSPLQQALLEPLFSVREDETGGLIFEQGDTADYLYILVEGEVQVRFKPDDGPAITVARIQPQGVVGWSAALGSPAYTSSAICTSRSRMLAISAEDLRWLCDEHPKTAALLLEQLADVIAQRLHGTHSQVVALLHQGLRVNSDSH